LKNEGRKILADYLPDSIIYDYNTNSLTRYFRDGHSGTKIDLNQFNEDSTEIEATKV